MANTDKENLEDIIEDEGQRSVIQGNLHYLTWPQPSYYWFLRSYTDDKHRNKLDDGKCNSRSRPYYPSRCKDKGLSSTTNIESLPDEMVSRILLELDVEDIYESAMLVCRRWYKITSTHNFKQEHLEHSNPGLVMSLAGSIFKAPSFVTLSRRGGIATIRKLKHFQNVSFVYWANGLALENHYLRDKYFVANHVTNKRIGLPPFSGREHTCNYNFCIGYAPASKEYKVVLLQFPGLKNPQAPICAAILTLGVDESWRYIDTRHVSLAAKGNFAGRPLVIEGFVHLFAPLSNRLLSLNLESEIITETLISKGGCLEIVLLTWKSLTMLKASPNNLSWDVWEMTKIPGEWNKLVKIDLEAQKGRMEKQLGCTLGGGLCPAGWLNNMEVLVLHERVFFHKPYLFYNVRTQEIQVVDMGYTTTVERHKNSLVWFDHT